MLYESPEHLPWLGCAQSLGLSIFEPLRDYVPGASFARLVRGLGTFALPPPRWEQWMHGVTRVPPDGLPMETLVFVTAPRSRAHKATHVVVRIDPPLRLGMYLRARTGERFEHPGVHLRNPYFDDYFHVQAARVERTLMFLEKRLPDDVLDRLHGARGSGRLDVVDDAVGLAMEGVVDQAPVLAQKIGIAAAVARMLAFKATTLPFDALDAPLAASWRGFGKLAFDDDRFCLEGPWAGMHVRVGLEGAPLRLTTSVRVDFPASLNLGLVLQRQTKSGFMIAVEAVQDITIGDPAFDDAFLVQAWLPEMAQRVFHDPAVRHALLELALNAEDIVMSDGSLTVVYPSIAHDERSLMSILERIATIGHVLFRSRLPAAPYR